MEVEFKESPERKLLEFFFKYPTSSFHYRELARRLDLSVGTVSKYIRSLKEKELVEVKTSGNLKIVKPHFNLKEFRNLKRCFNLRSLYTSGLIDLLDKKISPETLVLFGSYSRGEDHEESDIDLAVINGREEEIELEKFESKLKREIRLHYIDLEEVEREFLNSLANGIVLIGHLEVK